MLIPSVGASAACISAAREVIFGLPSSKIGEADRFELISSFSGRPSRLVIEYSPLNVLSCNSIWYDSIFSSSRIFSNFTCRKASSISLAFDAAALPCSANRTSISASSSLRDSICLSFSRKDTVRVSLSKDSREGRFWGDWEASRDFSDCRLFRRDLTWADSSIFDPIIDSFSSISRCC